MKYLTLKNMEKAVRIIQEKGYSKEEANNMAINAFALCQANRYNRSVECYLSEIIPYQDAVERGDYINL